MSVHRFIFMTVLLLVFAGSAAAQQIGFRIGGGLASHYSDSRPVGAFKLGVGCEVEFDQHWTLTPSLLFAGEGMVFVSSFLMTESLCWTRKAGPSRE